MLVFVTVWNAPGGPRREVTTRPAGAHVAKVHADHAKKFDGVTPIGEPPEMESPFADRFDQKRAQRTIYRDASGFRHGAFVLHKTPEEEAAVGAAIAEMDPKIKAFIDAGDIQEAARVDREKTAKVDAARGRVMHEASVAMHEAFPQWAKFDASNRTTAATIHAGQGPAQASAFLERARAHSRAHGHHVPEGR